MGSSAGEPQRHLQELLHGSLNSWWWDKYQGDGGTGRGSSLHTWLQLGAPCWAAAVPRPGWARLSCSELVGAWLTISFVCPTHFCCRISREFPHPKQTPAGFLPRLDCDFSLYVLLVCFSLFLLNNCACGNCSHFIWDRLHQNLPEWTWFSRTGFQKTVILQLKFKGQWFKKRYSLHLTPMFTEKPKGTAMCLDVKTAPGPWWKWSWETTHLFLHLLVAFEHEWNPKFNKRSINDS